MDQRDETTWVAIELTRQGEIRADEGTLEAQLRHDLDVDDDYPIFIPTAVFRRGDRTIVKALMNGYCFVATGLVDIDYFNLENLSYVSRVMTSRSGPYRMRYVSVITDANVRDMRKQLREMVAADIEMGANVLITEGQYRQLSGDVIGLDLESAYVRINLRSMQVVATVPRLFLDVLDPD